MILVISTMKIEDRLTSTIKKIEDLYKEDNISIYILSICKN